MASKDSRRSPRRSIASPPPPAPKRARVAGRRAQMLTAAPARANAKAAARAAPPAPSSRTRLEAAAGASQWPAGRRRNPYCNRRACPAHDDGVHRANFRRERIAVVKITQNALLMRNGHAEAGDSERLDGSDEIPKARAHEREGKRRLSCGRQMRRCASAGRANGRQDRR